MKVETQLLNGEDLNAIADQILYSVHLNKSETLEFVQTNKWHSEVTGYHLDEIRELGMEYLEALDSPKGWPYILSQFKEALS